MGRARSHWSSNDIGRSARARTLAWARAGRCWATRQVCQRCSNLGLQSRRGHHFGALSSHYAWDENPANGIGMLDITWSSGSSLLFELSPMSMNDCCASAKSADSGSVLLDVDAMDKAPRRAASSVSPMALKQLGGLVRVLQTSDAAARGGGRAERRQPQHPMQIECVRF